MNWQQRLFLILEGIDDLPEVEEMVKRFSDHGDLVKYEKNEGGGWYRFHDGLEVTTDGEGTIIKAGKPRATPKPKVATQPSASPPTPVPGIGKSAGLPKITEPKLPELSPESEPKLPEKPEELEAEPEEEPTNEPPSKP